MIRRCFKCGKEETNFEPLDAHHIIPKKGWEGHDRDGRVLLCQCCHVIIGNMLLAQVGKRLSEDDPEEWETCRGHIYQFTKWWLENGG